MEMIFRVWRYNPETDRAGRFQDFKVDVPKGWTVLDALNEIKWYQDGSLTYRRSCRHEICGSCAMTMNGVNGLSCSTQIEDLKSTTITVEPLKSLPVLRDLVPDMTDFFDKLRAVKPYLITDRPFTDRERPQTIHDRKIIDEATNCILCGSCSASCPSYWYDQKYLGPAALLKAYRFIFDSRDDGKAERIKIIDDNHGVWRCHTIFNCVECCPKNINLTEAIAELKKKAVLAAV